jgi:hypothetical protein
MQREAQRNQKAGQEEEQELPRSIRGRNCYLHPHNSISDRRTLCLKYERINILGPGYDPRQDRRFRVMQL